MPNPPSLLLATNNLGKVREFRRLLAAEGFTALTPGEAGIALEVEETGHTYEENARLKAVAFANAAGRLALADDSGIEVDALDGGPGMYSARFGGPGLDDVARTALLLEKLDGLPDERRTARYRAVVALAWPGGACHCFEAVQEGAIAHAPRGDRGFGYDPVFIADGSRVQAELSDEEKDRISHRGQAVRAALAWLREQCE